MWVAGTQVAEPSSAASHGVREQKAGLEAEELGQEPHSKVGCGHLRQHDSHGTECPPQSLFEVTVKSYSCSYA